MDRHFVGDEVATGLGFLALDAGGDRCALDGLPILKERGCLGNERNFYVNREGIKFGGNDE